MDLTNLIILFTKKDKRTKEYKNELHQLEEKIYKTNYDLLVLKAIKLLNKEDINILVKHCSIPDNITKDNEVLYKKIREELKISHKGTSRVVTSLYAIFIKQL